MPFEPNLGEAYLFYDEYCKKIEKDGKKPVSFLGFLFGKR